MEKQHKCSKCSKELANRHSLSRHKKMFCKERNSQSYNSVDQQDVLPSTARGIEKPTSKESSRQETSSAPSLRMWSDPAKSTNPKISALVDAIVNEEPISKPTSKDPDDSTTSKDCDYCSDENDSEIEAMDMTAKDMKFEDDCDDDDDDSDDDESYSGIEPIDMTAKDDSRIEPRDLTAAQDDSDDGDDNDSRIEPIDMTTKDDSRIEPMDLTVRDDDNISPDELKARLYSFDGNMKVFELNLDADKRLSKNDILKYAEELDIPYFRGVFERDGLPKSPNQKECGIVNLENHWVCYTKIYNTRCYFDSFGRKTPVEIEYYLKTAEEIKNNSPIIFRSGYMVQRENSKISGHLCLFVLTSLMREHLTYKQVTDQLIYGFSKHYW